MEIIKLIIIPYLSLASRFHGGGFISAPRVIRAAVFAVPYAVLFQNTYFGIPAFALAFIGKNVGHEDFWMMGTKIETRPEQNWLGKLVARTGLKEGTVAHGTLGMAIKGLITGLGTLNPLVIAGHATALPLSYFIGRRTKYGSELAEYLSGLLYGIILMGGT